MTRIFIIVVCLFAIGCGDASHPVGPNKPDDRKPVVVDEKAKAVDVWASLANAVDQGTISTTSRLARCVLVLAKNGDLSTADVEKFDAEFPKVASEERDLTKADGVTLRSIK